jgi:hypothetical protein
VTIRFYIDPATKQPHIYGHDVIEQEVEKARKALRRRQKPSSRKRP